MRPIGETLIVRSDTFQAVVLCIGQLFRASRESGEGVPESANDPVISFGLIAFSLVELSSPSLFLALLPAGRPLLLLSCHPIAGLR